MGTDRTTFAAAQAEAFPAPRSKTLGPSPRLDGHSLCAQERYSLGDAAPGDGLRLGEDLLAASARLAAGRGLAENPRTAPRQAPPSGPDRLVAGRGGQRVGPRGLGGDKTGPNPTDRGKSGSKHHLITDAQGVPFATILTAANTHDVTQLLPLVEAIPPVRGKRGRPRRKPEKVQGDRGYDSDPHRRALRTRKIEPILGKRRTEHGSGLGARRWVVERTLSWLHQNRALRIRYTRLSQIHEAFLSLGCILICWKRLNFL